MQTYVGGWSIWEKTAEGDVEAGVKVKKQADEIERRQLLTQSCMNPSNSPHATRAQYGRVTPRVVLEIYRKRASLMLVVIMRAFRQNCVD